MASNQSKRVERLERAVGMSDAYTFVDVLRAINDLEPDKGEWLRGLPAPSIPLAEGSYAAVVEVFRLEAHRMKTSNDPRPFGVERPKCEEPIQ